MSEALPEALRAQLEGMFQAAIAAVDPARLVPAALDGSLPGCEAVPQLLDGAQRIFLVAAGKAACGMADAIVARLRPRIAAGVVIGPPGAVRAADAPGDGPIRNFAGSHPVPDAASELAARAVVAMLAEARPDDLVALALSGGASALMALPAPGLTIDDKLAATELLLRAGASIRELNAVRRHLSAIKGGQVLRLIGGARLLSLIISDVAGNDLATIGSGPAAADPSTFEEARATLKRCQVWGRMPEAVRDHLDRGAAGRIAETLKPGDPALKRVTNLIIGDNAAALAGAEAAAREAGFSVDRWRELYGEADDLGRALAAHLCAMSRPRLCVIAGGEPVVTVRGRGRGGRAQQCALSLAIELERIGSGRGIAALAAGTDGIDGTTDAAGAFLSPRTVPLALVAGVDPRAALGRNDSYRVFEALGDLFKPGPTGTNVADIFIALVNY